MTASQPTIETERLILRGPRPHDWEPTRAYWGSDRSRFTGGPRPEGEAWLRFAARWGAVPLRGFGMFTVTLRGDDTAVGVVGPLFPPGWAEPELGWILFDGAEGRGIAFEAATAARDYVYGTLGWATAISYIHPENARSIVLAERLGCTPDPGVPYPFDEPTTVYRHPAPEAVA